MREVLLALLASAGAALWLNHVNGGAWTGHDQAAGLLLAQDCVSLSACHLTSVDSGLRGFTNGAMWPHLLTAVSLLGGATPAARAVLILMTSCGIGVVVLVVRRWLRPQLAFPSALFTLALLTNGPRLFVSNEVGDVAASNLVDASAVFFPAALCACLLLIFVCTRRIAVVALAAVCASHAMNTHVAAVTLLPALLAAAALAGPQPLRAALFALLIWLATTLLTSPGALFTSLAHLSGAELILFALGGIAITCIAATLSSWYTRLERRGRAIVLGVLLCGPTVAGALWFQLHGRGTSSRYVVPVMAPLAVAGAAALVLAVEWVGQPHRRAAWWGSIFASLVGAYAIGSAPLPRGAGEWSFEDGRLLAQHLEAEGWCYGQAFGRIQGPQCARITYALMPYACYAQSNDAFGQGRRQLRVWSVDNAASLELPASAATIVSSDARRIVVSAIDAWLDTPGAELCIESSPSPQGHTCTRPLPPDAAPFLYSRRLGLGFEDKMYIPPYAARFSFAVRPSAGEKRRVWFGERRTAVLNEQSPKCGWQVVEVIGLETDSALPANPVTLISRDGAPGRLVIERVAGTPDCPSGFPTQQIPCHWETSDNDPRWMKEVGAE